MPDPEVEDLDGPADSKGAPAPSGRAGRAARHLLPPSDGLRYRQLTLALGPDGGLALTAQERGASLEAAWGADDCEIALRLAAPAVARLALALVAERLQGRIDGVERLRGLCEAHGVAYELACWT